MNDEDFMNELEELTKNMTKEFSTNNKSSTGNLEINQKKEENELGFNLNGNEMDYMKEIEKLLSMSGNLKLDDEADPQTKEMMNLLSI
jgi:hypothetical protein